VNSRLEKAFVQDLKSCYKSLKEKFHSKPACNLLPHTKGAVRKDVHVVLLTMTYIM